MISGPAPEPSAQLRAIIYRWWDVVPIAFKYAKSAWSLRYGDRVVTEADKKKVPAALESLLADVAAEGAMHLHQGSTHLCEPVGSSRAVCVLHRDRASAERAAATLREGARAYAQEDHPGLRVQAVFLEDPRASAGAVDLLEDPVLYEPAASGWRPAPRSLEHVHEALAYGDVALGSSAPPAPEIVRQLQTLHASAWDELLHGILRGVWRKAVAFGALAVVVSVLPEAWLSVQLAVPVAALAALAARAPAVTRALSSNRLAAPVALFAYALCLWPGALQRLRPSRK